VCVYVCVCVSAATLETACFLSGMSAARYERVSVGGGRGGEGGGGQRGAEKRDREEKETYYQGSGG
jgi:hypothetical protein